MQILITVKPTLESLGDASSKIDINSFLEREIKKITFGVERFSKQLTPVDTGRLRASINVSWFSSLQSKVSTNTKYAIFVHEGTRYMRSRPFMTMGATFAQADEIKNINERLDAEFVKAFKSL